MPDINSINEKKFTQVRKENVSPASEVFKNFESLDASKDILQSSPSQEEFQKKIDTMPSGSIIEEKIKPIIDNTATVDSTAMLPEQQHQAILELLSKEAASDDDLYKLSTDVLGETEQPENK